MTWPILSIVIFLPLVGAAFILALRGDDEAIRNNARWTALWTTLLTFFISIFLITGFDRGIPDFQFVENHYWLGGTIRYHLGVDGISLPFVILTTALMPVAILASFLAVSHRVKEYMIAFLVLETLMIGTFAALDIVLFYVFFEGGLIPMFLIIGIWGGKRRVYASFKFFLYTLLGSVLMLLAILAMYLHAGSTDITVLLTHGFPRDWQPWLFLAFLASFAVKLPMWPVHTWLPDAHVEAPTAGSVILAGVLLKMGTYGFMKLAFPLFPDATRLLAPIFGTLAVVSIIYGACLALVQTDIKKIIAYSSISHLGYVMLGLISLDLLGIQGAVMQMVSHGLVAGGLFLMVGMVYERCHTRDLAAYGGLAKLLPVYSVFFMVLTLAAIGLPTTSGFTGEFLVLLGAFRAAWPQYVQGAAYPLIVSASAVAGVVLGPLYMLWFAQRFLFGPAKAPHLPLVDLNLREKTILAAIVVAVFALGLFPEEPMRKTELAARQYQVLVAGLRTGLPVATLRQLPSSPPGSQTRPATPLASATTP